jgi:hypothetical protein
MLLTVCDVGALGGRCRSRPLGDATRDRIQHYMMTNGDGADTYSLDGLLAERMGVKPMSRLWEVA